VCGRRTQLRSKDKTSESKEGPRTKRGRAVQTESRDRGGTTSQGWPGRGPERGKELSTGEGRGRNEKSQHRGQAPDAGADRAGRRKKDRRGGKRGAKDTQGNGETEAEKRGRRAKVTRKESRKRKRKKKRRKGRIKRRACRKARKDGRPTSAEEIAPRRRGSKGWAMGGAAVKRGAAQRGPPKTQPREGAPVAAPGGGDETKGRRGACTQGAQSHPRDAPQPKQDNDGTERNQRRPKQAADAAEKTGNEESRKMHKEQTKSKH